MSNDIARKQDTAVEKRKSLRTAVPDVDIYENDDEILVYADMPGVVKENVSVDIDNGTLSLKGTRQVDTGGTANWMEFSDLEYARVFSVPQSIDMGRVTAELKDGVLKLHLPKSEEAKPHQIEIKAA